MNKPYINWRFSDTDCVEILFYELRLWVDLRGANKIYADWKKIGGFTWITCVPREKKFETRKISRRQFCNHLLASFWDICGDIYIHGERRAKWNWRLDEEEICSLLDLHEKPILLLLDMPIQGMELFKLLQIDYNSIESSVHLNMLSPAKSSCESVLYSAAVFLLKWENEIFYFFHVVIEYFFTLFSFINFYVKLPLSHTYMREMKSEVRYFPVCSLS